MRGITVVKDDKDEFISIRKITGWGMCIDHKKANSIT